MANAEQLRDPWLVAVWPGMGSVAVLAGSYLLQQLGVHRATELDSHDFFEIQGIDVKNGIATVGALPRCMFFEWRDPRERHDLLIFAGEAQPPSGGYALCQRIIDHAVQRGVKQVFTFAAMATQLELGSRPRVFAVATDLPSLAPVKALGAEVLKEGQITGLNGTLLGAAASRGLHGVCLLGEMPYFASAVPNPRAARVVLESFAELAGIEIDFAGLEAQAREVEEKLEHLLEQMQNQGRQPGEFEPEEPEPERAGQPAPARPALDARAQQRIESLFEKAREDRSRAVDLKRELDRLGVFKEYEDRFLDLFRNAG